MDKEILCGVVLIVFAILHGGNRYFFSRNNFNLADFAIWMTCLYVGFGPVLSYISGYDDVYATESLNGSVLISSMTFIAGIMLAQISSRLVARQGLQKNRENFHTDGLFVIPHILDKISGGYFLAAYSIIWIYRVYIFLLGGGFSGTDSLSVMLSIPYWVIVLQFIFSPMSYILIFYVLRRIQTNNINIYWILLLVVETIFTFTRGRRDMINMLLVYGLALLILHKKLYLKHIIAGGFVVYILATVVFPFFWHFRLNLQENMSQYGDRSVKNVLAQVESSELDNSYFKAKYSNNIQVRARMNYMWIQVVEDAVYKKGALRGEVFFSAFMGALPRFIRPTKYWFDNASVIQDNYGFPRGDTSDNFIAAGYADFKLVGVYVAGLVIGITLTLLPIINFSQNKNYPLISIIIFGHLLPLALDFEISPTSYFAMLRSIALLLVVVNLLPYISNRKLHL